MENFKILFSFLLIRKCRSKNCWERGGLKHRDTYQVQSRDKTSYSQFIYRGVDYSRKGAHLDTGNNIIMCLINTKLYEEILIYKSATYRSRQNQKDRNRNIKIQFSLVILLIILMITRILLLDHMIINVSQGVKAGVVEPSIHYINLLNLIKNIYSSDLKLQNPMV